MCVYLCRFLPLPSVDSSAQVFELQGFYETSIFPVYVVVASYKAIVLTWRVRMCVAEQVYVLYDCYF